MSENKQLPATIQNQPGRGLQITNLDDLKGVAALMLQSGIFEDLDGGPDKALGKAAVKIVAGQELGLPAFAAMKGIHLIKGKATPSYQMVGAIIKRSPNHDYKVLRSDAECAQIEFFTNGVSQGISKFDTADMQRANLGGDNWRKYPQQMRFARAMTMGANLYCPEIFAGPVYTPDEMGVNVDDEGNPIETASTVEVQQESQKKPRGRGSSASSAQAKESPPATAAAAANTQTSPASSAEKQQEPAKTSAENATNQSPSDEAEDTEIVESIEIVDAKNAPPGPDVLAQILQTALSSGWSEEDAEQYLGEQLEKAKIPGDLEVAEITAKMGWKMVEEIINFFLSHKK